MKLKLRVSRSEHEIISGCKAQSEKWQEILYKQYYGYAMAVSLTYCKDRSLAQEITDDAFMKVFKTIEHYDESLSFKPWLRRIVVNTAIDHFRKNKNHYNNHELSELSSKNAPPHHYVDQLDVEDIYKLINQLPEILKIVFNLYEIEGYSHKEISLSLDISESSSRTYLMRAKGRLRELLKRHY